MDAGGMPPCSPNDLTEREAGDLVLAASLTHEQRARSIHDALKKMGFLAEFRARQVSLRGPAIFHYMVLVPRKQAERALAYVRREFPAECPAPTERERMAERVAGMLVYFSAARQVAYVLLGGGLALLALGATYLERGMTEDAYFALPLHAIDFSQAHAVWTVRDAGAWAHIHVVAGPACMIGAAMLVAGTLILAHRYSLRWMLFGALAAGLCGSVPFALIPHRTGGARLEAFLPLRNTEYEYSRQFMPMQWRTARKTLPPEMRTYLDMDRYASDVETAITFVSTRTGVRVTCSVLFPPGMNEERCATLAAFYREYLDRLACKAMKQPAGTLPPIRGSQWGRWRDTWLQGITEAPAVKSP